jgi:hypothetical protein
VISAAKAHEIGATCTQTHVEDVEATGEKIEAGLRNIDPIAVCGRFEKDGPVRAKGSDNVRSSHDVCWWSST